MKKSIFIFTAVILGVVACNREDNPNGNLSNSFEDSNIQYFSNSRVFTNQHIQQLSNYHNLYCDSIIQSLDITSSFVQSDVLDIANGYISVINNELDLPNPITYNDLINTEQAVTNYVNNKDDFNTLLTEVEDLFLNLDITSASCYDDLEIHLEILKSMAANDFSGSDLDGAYALIETLKKSAHFWLPVSAGGSGVGYRAFEDYLDFNPDYLPGIPMGDILGKTALADGCSMFTLCMVLGVSGAINPALVPTSLFLYFGAGVASVSVNTFFQLLVE